MDWEHVVKSSHWMSLKDIEPCPQTVVDDLVRLGDGMYTVPLPYSQGMDSSDPGCPYAGVIVWAPSDGAARRALSNDIEAYDQVTEASPPPPLLVYGGTYGDIVDAAKQRGAPYREYSVYRIAQDGLFVCRCVEIDGFKFYFRARKSTRMERPFAVSVSLGRRSN